MRTIHVVSHTHWDREWYRPFQSFRLKLVHLIDGLIDLLEKDPQFKYFMLDGQTIVLDDYLTLRPEMEPVLRRHIQKGRILIGPWHILPDMFLVGPESHVRNLLQGDQTARKFGPKMMIGYIPDPFGHPGQVPQILRGFDIETACLWRGLDEQPAEFWWQSPDGTRVLMLNLRDSYSNGASLPTESPSDFANILSLAADSLAAHSLVSDYLVMFGTDHMEPPSCTSNAITSAGSLLEDTQVIHSTLPRFLGAVQADIKKQKLFLPTFTGELRACKRMHLLPGVLSTRIWIKQRNHASETLFTKWVEPFATWQELVTSSGSIALDQKSSIIHHAWRLLMENHPHDSICGCSIDQVHDEMKVRFDQVDQIGEELTRQSLEALGSMLDTQSSKQDQKSAIVIFNPNSNRRTDLVNVTLELPPEVQAFDLVDERGDILPHQAYTSSGQEIINVTMDAGGLQSAFGSISDGRVAGMTIQDIKIRRDLSQVFIDATLADDGEPNISAWTLGLKQVEGFFTDPSISEYHVHARRISPTQIIVTVPNVPGLGYRTLWLRPRHAEQKAPLKLAGPLVKILLPLARLPIIQALSSQPRNNPKPPYKIENEFFAIEVSRDGTLEVLDKHTSRRYPGLNRFIDGADCGDEYNYSPPVADYFVTPCLKHVTVESGTVQKTIRLDLDLPTPASLTSDRKSRSKQILVTHISSTITLSNAIPRIDIYTTIENSAKDHRLRVHFPAPFTSETGFQDGHFEVVERKLTLPFFDETWIEQPRPEVPQRTFTDISDGRLGLMLANRGLPEVEVLKNSHGNSEIALTLLRCIGWLSRDDLSARKGHAGPFMETPGAQMIGKWSFDYSIIPHSGNWQSAYWQAYAFETPFRAVTASLHAGELPQFGSFLETAPESFVVSAVKRSEDGRGWLVRGYNITGEEITVSLKPWKSFKHVELVNLLEKKQIQLNPDISGRVTIPVKGFAIASILFQE
jgi:mannosylglycerate hydrolase